MGAAGAAEGGGEAEGVEGLEREETTADTVALTSKRGAVVTLSALAEGSTV